MGAKLPHWVGCPLPWVTMPSSRLSGLLILAGSCITALVACGGEPEDSQGSANGGAAASEGGRGASAGRGGGTSSKGGAASMSGGAASTSGGATGSGAATTGSSDVYGAKHTGQYHLGPVDFAETEWHNACAPQGGYRAALRDSAGLGGEFLAGVANEFAQGGGVCDACILIQTAKGESIVARVVTYGVEQDPNDIDVSPSVYAAIHQGEYPRTMTWQFAKCPDTGSLRYEFQTASSIWWTSLWVRNPRVPLSKVEVQSSNHASFFELRRETDGTLNDDGGFGEGAFTLRFTGLDGQVVTEKRTSFTAGELTTGSAQFQ
jgi:hypothetical protein